MIKNILSSRYGINEKNLLSVVENAKDYAFHKGIFLRSHDGSHDSRTQLAFCLVPSSFSAKYFHIVRDLQVHMNYVLLQISNSREMLKECLANAKEVDDFTRNIYKIYEATHDNEESTLSLIRSDYMLNSDSSGNITGIKQIECNVISTSFAGLATRVKEVQEFVLKRNNKEYESNLPSNDAVSGFAKGLILAWDTYGNKNAVVLVVVEDVTYNISDQRILEYTIYEYEKNLEVIRCTFKELRKLAELKEKVLLVNNKEVAVVYYRTGYVPEQYEPEDWDVRLLMEQSKAIKCPSAAMHLAGSKTIQTYISQPGILEKFVSSEIAVALREVFAGLYNLNMGKDGDEAISMAIENPEKFVLKPDREGGGNNVFGEDIRHLLQKIKNSKEREAYILMEKINAPKQHNCIILKDTVPVIKEVISELGIYGVIIGNKEKVLTNKVTGHLLRTKFADLNETGVAAGFGSLDSPFLE